MHKAFYASGFLYHPPTQQILLQIEKLDEDNTVWSLIGGHGKSGEDDKKAIKRIFLSLLGLDIKDHNINSVYSYFNEELSSDHFIVYAHIRKPEIFKPKKKKTFSWYTQKQIMKLPLAQQTKHDITISKRVIDLGIREAEAKKLL